MESNNIQVIEEHSVDLALLPEKANILDLGCLGFDFTNHFRNLGHNVKAIDIQDFEGDYQMVAVSDYIGVANIKFTNDKQATSIQQHATGGKIDCVTLPEITKAYGVEKWDLIKMDIEGEEIKVLKSIPHPYCQQISVEFHAHCGGQTKESLDALLDWLSEWYTIHNRIWESRHCAGFNYWDVLLIKK